MQVALHGELQVQDRVAEHGALMLGTGNAEPPMRYRAFRLGKVRHYVRRPARRLRFFAAPRSGQGALKIGLKVVESPRGVSLRI